MNGRSEGKLDEAGKASVRRLPSYDGSVFKVMLLASVLLVFSTVLIGVLSYRITEQEAIRKLKTSDLFWTAQSMAGHVEGRIARALETSAMLADDPAVIAWVKGGESDDRLGDLIRQRLIDIRSDYDYTNSFVVSAVTRQYWTETGEVLEKVERTDPDDGWFFGMIDAGKETEIVVDRNEARQDTFVFVDVLVGDASDPLGVAGVGLSLQTLSDEFAAFKYGKNGRLWMVGRDGTIHLSDRPQEMGMNVGEFLEADDGRKLLEARTEREYVMEAKDASGRLVDMISYPIEAADMRFVVLIPRSETVEFLSGIRNNTAIAVVVSLLAVVFLFTYVSRRLADPYKRALRINNELESVVDARTKELADANREMTDSISYASRLQLSVLPGERAMGAVLGSYFAVWMPRSGVGGDFYWGRQVGGAKWIAVGDCTGHGVPGALMTMLSVSLLDRIADRADESMQPSEALGKLNILLKETLHQYEADGPTDDGLDLGLIVIRDGRLTYAGAGIVLFVSGADGIVQHRGDKHKIGYRRTPADAVYADTDVTGGEDAVYYMASDGIADQNGGPHARSLGRTRLAEWLHGYRGLPMEEQKEKFERELKAFMNGEPQRDDMTLLAFKPAP